MKKLFNVKTLRSFLVSFLLLFMVLISEQYYKGASVVVPMVDSFY